MTKELAIRILTGEVLGTTEQTKEAVTMAVRALSQPKPHWISCSARLPEKSGDYVATFKGAEGYFVDLAYWNETFGGRWQAIIDDDGFCDVCNVIAWLPLPEPWKEVEGGI